MDNKELLLCGGTALVPTHYLTVGYWDTGASGGLLDIRNVGAGFSYDSKNNPTGSVGTVSPTALNGKTITEIFVRHWPEPGDYGLAGGKVYYAWIFTLNGKNTGLGGEIFTGYDVSITVLETGKTWLLTPNGESTGVVSDAYAFSENSITGDTGLSSLYADLKSRQGVQVPLAITLKARN